MQPKTYTNRNLPPHHFLAYMLYSIVKKGKEKKPVLDTFSNSHEDAVAKSLNCVKLNSPLPKAATENKMRNMFESVRCNFVSAFSLRASVSSNGAAQTLDASCYRWLRWERH